ncbi:isocitrate lyase/PEP mutase family protein [Nocardia sputorum]|uniref:isocitrate lyase/PEP mutase family protein n=1 Tax=Nocardia sputorum TaxID=2984338 RepID=UPI00249086FD|nr:isocitrate lyase/PEP mutase family protein [Nocardia sputorum]
MSAPGLIVAPGAYDALSARLVAQADYPAVYLTGFGSAASTLGKPDVGLMTMTEMTQRAAAFTESVPHIPIIADADTGYGNPVNVRRTVREYERAGVAGIHLEDQVWPKKCGHLDGKRVIARDEMVQKIRAALDAREDPDFVIIGRTDANTVNGFDDALSRAEAYAAAGADMILIEAPQSQEELITISERFRGIPLAFNWVESGRMPLPSQVELEELGFKLVLYSVCVLFAAAHNVVALLEFMRQGGSPTNFPGKLSFAEFTDRIGLPEIWKLEQRYEIYKETVTSATGYF